MTPQELQDLPDELENLAATNVLRRSAIRWDGCRAERRSGCRRRGTHRARAGHPLEMREAEALQPIILVQVDTDVVFLHVARRLR
jgi:hypothetical protein